MLCSTSEQQDCHQTSLTYKACLLELVVEARCQHRPSFPMLGRAALEDALKDILSSLWPEEKRKFNEETRDPSPRDLQSLWREYQVASMTATFEPFSRHFPIAQF